MQRQQKKVAEENSVYFGILQKALPPPPPDQTKATDESHQPSGVEEICNNVSNHVPTAGVGSSSSSSSSSERHHHGKSGHKISPRSSSSSSSVSNSGGGSGFGGGSGSGRTSHSQKARSSSDSKHRLSSGLKIQQHEARERSSLVNRHQQQSSASATSPVASAEPPSTPTSPVSPTSTSGTVESIATIPASTAPVMANGDIGGGSSSVEGSGGLVATQSSSATAGTKVGVVLGKKQATVRAVPRTDQPLTTAQEKVSL